MITIDQSLVYKIPDNVTLRNAAMTELASCVYQCMEECDFHYGDEVLVLGRWCQRYIDRPNGKEF